MRRLRRALSLAGTIWPTMRVQLTLLYTGALVAVVAAVLAAAGLLIGSSSSAAPGSPGSIIANSQQSIDVHRFDDAAAVIFVVAALIAVVLGWSIAGRLLRPLRTITATARDISARNLTQRIRVDGADDELKQLGATLNDLFERLDSAFQSQRHFVANASHELRTPLAGQRTLLQVALADPNADTVSLKAACEEALQLGAQQEQLIDALLTLAVGERGIERRVPFDLRDLAQAAVETRRQQAERGHLNVVADLQSAPLSGDPRLIESLVSNLLDNAIRHNVSGGVIEAATMTQDGRATLSVRNTGPVVPPAQIDRLFQPFQQVGHKRTGHNGHGLGLAIVRAIAEAHAATLSVEPDPTGGLTIQVTFG